MPSVRDDDGPLVERYWQGKSELLGDSPVSVPICPPQIPHSFPGPPLWQAGQSHGAAYSFSSCLHVVCSNHCTSDTGLRHCREPDSWFSVYSIWTKHHSISDWFNPESAIKFVNKSLNADIRFHWTGQILVPIPSLIKDSWTQWTSHCLSVCLSVQKWIWLVGSFIATLVVYVHPANAREMMQGPLLIHWHQWLCRHCSGSNAVKKPELTTTSGCSGSKRVCWAKCKQLNASWWRKINAWPTKRPYRSLKHTMWYRNTRGI